MTFGFLPESNTEVPGKREGLPEHDYDHLLLQELRRLKAYNEKVAQLLHTKADIFSMHVFVPI